MTRGNDIVSIEFPQADIDRFTRALRSIPEKTGKSAKQAVTWASVYLLRSFSASTKVSAKKRKIVMNPLFEMKGKSTEERALARAARADMRRARYGVMKYQRDGTQKFSPIYRGGEFGAAMKFISRKKTLVKVGNRWEEYKPGEQEGTGETIPGLANHPKTKIGRSGMAKKVWTWAQSNTIRGGTCSAFDVPDVASITWRGGTVSPEITIRNKLRYALKAFAGGRETVESAYGRAAAALEHRISEEADKRIAEAARA